MATGYPGTALCVLLCATIVACTPTPAPDTAPTAPAGATPSAPAATRDAVPVAMVRITSPEATGSRAVGLAGLVTALYELGLADLEGVVPSVGGVAPSPSLRTPMMAGSETWTASLGVTSNPWQLSVELCRQGGGCEVRTSQQGSPDAPWLAVADVLQQSANQLLRAPATGSTAAWAEPISGDPYAVLMTGRSAATFYGLREPVPALVVGDPRRDAITRAVFIDPGMAVAGWLLARRELDDGRPLVARGVLGRAALARPSSLVMLADEGPQLVALDKPEAAARVWRTVRSQASDDLRFLVPTARSQLAEGDLDAAAELLDGWNELILRDPQVAALRVALAEAGRELARYDDLLHTWQDAAPTDPEPVRRRINIRVRQSAYPAALDLIPELKVRGAQDEAVALSIALAAALRRWSTAADEAESAGQLDLARRLRSRAALEARPAQVPAELLDDPAPESRTAVAQARLRAGDPQGAIEVIDKVLASRRYDVPALLVRVAASKGLTDPRSVKARADLQSVSPQGSFVSPRTAPGSTPSEGQPQSP